MIIDQTTESFISNSSLLTNNPFPRQTKNEINDGASI